MLNAKLKKLHDEVIENIVNSEKVIAIDESFIRSVNEQASEEEINNVYKERVGDKCNDTIYPLLANKKLLNMYIEETINIVFKNIKKDIKAKVGDSPNYLNSGYSEFDNLFTMSLESLRSLESLTDDKIINIFKHWLKYIISCLEIKDLGLEYEFDGKPNVFVYNIKNFEEMEIENILDIRDSLIHVVNGLYSIYGRDNFLPIPSEVQKSIAKHENMRTSYSADNVNIEKLKEMFGENFNVEDSIRCVITKEHAEDLNKLEDLTKVICDIDNIENNMKFVYGSLDAVLSVTNGKMLALTNIISPLTYFIGKMRNLKIDNFHIMNFKLFKNIGYVGIGLLHTLFKLYLKNTDNVSDKLASEKMLSIRDLYPMKTSLDVIIDRAISEGEDFHHKPSQSLVNFIASSIATCKINVSLFSGRFQTEKNFLNVSYGVADKRTVLSKEKRREYEKNINNYAVGSFKGRNMISMLQSGSYFRKDCIKPSLAFYMTYNASVDLSLEYLKAFYMKDYISVPMETVDKNCENLTTALSFWFKKRDSLNIAITTNLSESSVPSVLTRFQSKTFTEIRTYYQNGVYEDRNYINSREEFVTKFKADILNLFGPAETLQEEPCGYIDGVVNVKPYTMQEIFSLRLGGIGKEKSLYGKNNDLYNFIVALIRTMVVIGPYIKTSENVHHQLPNFRKDEFGRVSHLNGGVLECRNDYIMATISKKTEDKLSKAFGKDIDVLKGIELLLVTLSEYYDINFFVNSLACLNIYHFIVSNYTYITSLFEGGITRRNILALSIKLANTTCNHINFHLNYSVYPELNLDTVIDTKSVVPEDVNKFAITLKLYNIIHSVQDKNTGLTIDTLPIDVSFNNSLLISKKTSGGTKNEVVKKKTKTMKKKEYVSKSNIDYKIEYLNTDLNLEFVIKKLSEGKLVKCLIEGVPGSGKSEFAYYVAKRLGVEVNYINVSDYSKKYVGEGEETMTKIFNDAEKHGKLVIIDECDTLFTTREDDKLAHYVSNMTNHMLNEINKRELNMFFTTNYMDRIDSAMIRRIDLKLKFGTLKNEYKLPLFLELVEKSSCVGEVDKERIGRELNRLELTPGVYKSALNKLQWVENVTVERAIEELKKESKLIIKGTGNSLGFCV